jgi:hypothetical protein
MAQPSTSPLLISRADRKIRYGPITHHNYSDRLLAQLFMNAVAKGWDRGPHFTRSTQALSRPPNLRLPRQALDPLDVPFPGFPRT